MAANKRMFVSQEKSRDQNWKKKNTFPKEFFNKMWLKVEEHK